ncbi:MAG: helix-turn-helix domain-containing protein [Bacteroidaceae bacterium]|nr:helix-turn-helix domain-containing protein [Bacteroidaceae bacterium]
MENGTNIQLRQAWDFVEHTGRSIFLTGKAGTGKTTFLKTVVERSKKRSVVVAPTGVAAINAGGMTIHSFFQLPLSPFVPGAKIEQKFEFSREKRKIIASLDLLIIDEISMVRSDLLDAIDSVLRRFRDHYLPFGGVQLLLIGDLAQLTPVVTPEDEQMLRGYYDTPYFFGSKALSQIEYVTIQLEHVFRQQNTDFIAILNHIREGHPSVADLDALNTRCLPGFVPNPDEGYIRLTTHNRLADQYNEGELQKLPSPLFRFDASIQGTFPEYAYPTSPVLELKVGTQVMFVKNDLSPDHRYYNGRIGRVTRLEKGHIEVLCVGDAEPIEVEPLTWENARYTLNEDTRAIETEVLGTFCQYPLRMAWAITIHKSQGLTFDRAIIDANLSFAPGQVYVALSRCRTLEGMVLASPLELRAIINDQRVEDYISQQEGEAQRSIAQLPALKEEYFRHLLLELFDFRSLLYQEEHMLRLFAEFFYHSHSQLDNLHKQALEALRQRVIDVAGRWTSLIQRATTDQLHAPDFLDRVRRSATYFAQELETILEAPIRLTAEVQTGNKQAMRRLANALPELRQTWLSRRYLLGQIADSGFSIPTYLHEKQMSMLDALDEKTLKKKREKKEKKKKAPKPKTWEVSLSLYRQGMNPDLIAHERGLTIGTIMGHLLRYVASGEIPFDELIPPERVALVRQAIAAAGPGAPLYVIRDHCPKDVSYDEIRAIQEQKISKQ